MKSSRPVQTPTVQILANGSVDIGHAEGLMATVSPEVFAEGWKKHAPVDGPAEPGYEGVIPFEGGARIGLSTKVTARGSNLQFRFRLVALETLRAIHVRIVVSLPYEAWQGSPYRWGSQQGPIPGPAPAVNRLAEADSGPLLLGPSAALRGRTLRLDGPGLLAVLQDNRQWTPFLQAFVTHNETTDPAWTWKAGQERTYDFTLSFLETTKDGLSQ